MKTMKCPECSEIATFTITQCSDKFSSANLELDGDEIVEGEFEELPNHPADGNVSWSEITCDECGAIVEQEDILVTEGRDTVELEQGGNVAV